MQRKSAPSLPTYPSVSTPTSLAPLSLVYQIAIQLKSLLSLSSPPTSVTESESSLAGDQVLDLAAKVDRKRSARSGRNIVTIVTIIIIISIRSSQSALKISAASL